MTTGSQLGNNNPTLDDSASFSDLGSLSDLFQEDLNDINDASESIINRLTPVKEFTNSGLSHNMTSSEGDCKVVGHLQNGGQEPVKFFSPAAEEEEMNNSNYIASAVPVRQPNENDVLLGRGGRNNQWTGNQNLRVMACEMSVAYSAAPKRNKPAIATLLMNKVRALNPQGRYVLFKNLF